MDKVSRNQITHIGKLKSINHIIKLELEVNIYIYIYIKQNVNYYYHY